MDTNNAQVILDAGASLVEPVREHGGIPYVALPDGYSVNDLENLMPQPSRKRAKVVMLDSPSFIAYAKKHGSMDNCTLYADVDYDSAVLAHSVAKQQRRREESRVVVYRCQTCTGWHIGNKRPKSYCKEREE